MMRRAAWLLPLLAVTACGDDSAVEPTNLSVADKVAMARQTVAIGTEDGHKVPGDYAPVEKARATIVLLHQAGSSAGEYADIAPRLNEVGYSTLAIDARSGGEMFGANRTVNRYGNKGEDYLATLPDLEAALNWAKLQGKPVILWGSSYSASLAITLAADNPDLVSAVLAFSPGEYFPDKSLVRTTAGKLKAPIFITHDGTAKEQAEAKAIFDVIPGVNKVFVSPTISGVHGSSTLIASRNPKGAEANFASVLKFLAELRF